MVANPLPLPPPPPPPLRPPPPRRRAAAQALGFYSWAEHRCGFATTSSPAAPWPASSPAPAPSRLWRFLRRSETLVTTPTVTSVIQTLGEEGLFKQALAAFYRMKQLHCKPDVRCYNAVIAALCRAGWFRKARFLLDQMELPGARCPPDSYTYTIFITFYCKRSLETGCRKAIRRRIWEANHMFRRMVFNGYTPDVVTYNCLIDGLCKTYRIGRAHELFDEMSKKGCTPNRVTYNSFIRYYGAINEVDKAVNMMRDMVEREHGKPTSSSYTPIIHSLCESHRIKEARDFLVEMVEGGHVPREFTYKLVRNALDCAGEEGLPEEMCQWIEDGIDARIKQVMRVKPLMRR
ncbi:Pentatricopeptide repeat-containing protein [Ananas comosus]|uniref:Pentatricopeptide repeat-containing protein n=1 Tax=Ananas comosus TaxID=4615 RepID=A0A199UYA1_ANACO|nr:Pentatricopeptide repeat-containing protein [Ananas comosus]